MKSSNVFLYLFRFQFACCLSFFFKTSLVTVFYLTLTSKYTLICDFLFIFVSVNAQNFDRQFIKLNSTASCTVCQEMAKKL